MLLIALASILYGSAMAFTTPDSRLILGYSSVAQLGFITLGIFSLQDDRRPGRAAAGRQPRPRGGARVLHRRAARGARGRLGGHPRHGRHRLPRAGARDAVPDRRAGQPGDARARRTSSASSSSCSASSTRRSSSRSSPSSASCWRASTRCGCSSGRCTTASGRTSTRARSPFADGLVHRAARGWPSSRSRCIPQLALDRSEAVGPGRRVQPRPRKAPREDGDRRRPRVRTSTGPGCRRCSRCWAAATLVLLLGPAAPARRCARSLVPLLALAGFAGRDRAGHLAVGRAEGPHLRRPAPRRPHARALASSSARGGAAAVLLSWRARGAARGRPRRVLRAAAHLGGGHVRARRGAEPRDGVPRARAAVDPALRAVRDGDAPRDARSSRG